MAGFDGEKQRPLSLPAIPPLMTSWIRGTVFVAACAASATRAQAQHRGRQGQTGLVHADSASMWVDAPKGWLLDAQAGRAQGAPAVFYRKGESWEQGTAVMYVNPSARSPRELADIIRADEAEFRGHAADMQIDAIPAVHLASGDTVAMRTFFSATSQNYDAVAYVTSDRAVWFVVLTARTREAFDAALPALRALVASCAPGPTVRLQRP